MSDRCNCRFAGPTGENPDADPRERYQSADAKSNHLDPLPVGDGRRVRGLNDLFQRLHLAADLGIELPADRDCRVQPVDPVNLLVKPRMDRRPAVMGGLLLVTEIFLQAPHAFFNAPERPQDVVIRCRHVRPDPSLHHGGDAIGIPSRIVRSRLQPGLIRVPAGVCHGPPCPADVRRDPGFSRGGICLLQALARRQKRRAPEHQQQRQRAAGVCSRFH